MPGGNKADSLSAPGQPIKEEVTEVIDVTDLKTLKEDRTFADLKTLNSTLQQMRKELHHLDQEDRTDYASPIQTASKSRGGENERVSHLARETFSKERDFIIDLTDVEETDSGTAKVEVKKRQPPKPEAVKGLISKPKAKDEPERSVGINSTTFDEDVAGRLRAIYAKRPDSTIIIAVPSEEDQSCVPSTNKILQDFAEDISYGLNTVNDDVEEIEAIKDKSAKGEDKRGELETKGESTTERTQSDIEPVGKEAQARKAETCIAETQHCMQSFKEDISYVTGLGLNKIFRKKNLSSSASKEGGKSTSLVAGDNDGPKSKSKLSCLPQDDDSGVIAATVDCLNTLKEDVKYTVGSIKNMKVKGLLVGFKKGDTESCCNASEDDNSTLSSQGISQDQLLAQKAEVYVEAVAEYAEPSPEEDPETEESSAESSPEENVFAENPEIEGASAETSLEENVLAEDPEIEEAEDLLDPVKALLEAEEVSMGDKENEEESIKKMQEGLLEYSDDEFVEDDLNEALGPDDISEDPFVQTVSEDFPLLAEDEI
jgi:hypothetical protein